MGLRGCVDAWGEPVRKPKLGGQAERFKPELSLTAPESNKAESNKPSLTAPRAPPRRVAKKPKPAAPPSSPSDSAFDRAAYQRAYMQARRAKAKASKPG